MPSDPTGLCRDGELLSARREGVVVAFDADAGTGSVALAGGVLCEFHCVEIANGSRAIELGTPVFFSLAPVNLGRLEAVGLVAVRR